MQASNSRCGLHVPAMNGLALEGLRSSDPRTLLSYGCGATAAALQLRRYGCGVMDVVLWMWQAPPSKPPRAVRSHVWRAI